MMCNGAPLTSGKQLSSHVKSSLTLKLQRVATNGLIYGNCFSDSFFSFEDFVNFMHVWLGMLNILGANASFPLN